MNILLCKEWVIGEKHGQSGLSPECTAVVRVREVVWRAVAEVEMKKVLYWSKDILYGAKQR